MPSDLRDASFDTIYNLAQKNSSVYFLTADLGAFSLTKFRKELPQQFINVGIAEQNLITVAAGLAMAGKHVFVYSIIPFITMRCLEQVKVCLADAALPVCLIGSGAGFTYGADGPTHHGLHDIGIMRAIGSIAIHNPCDALSASQAVQQSYTSTIPSYIRVESGTYNDIYDTSEEINWGMKKIVNGSKVYILTTGAMTHRVLKAISSELGTTIGVIDICRLDKLDTERLKYLIGSVRKILTIEEHFIHGGLGTLVQENLAGADFIIQKMGVADTNPINYGNREWLLQQYSLDEDAIANAILNLVKY